MSAVRWTAAAVAMVALLSVGCGAAPGTPQPASGTGPTSTTSGSSPTSAPGTSAGQATGQPRALPIYYVVETRVGLRLFREFHSVPAAADPASDAARELFARPVGADPDYRSYWPAQTRLRGNVQHGGGVITVDLTAQAQDAQLGAEAAQRTVDQLVYTVQGALQSTDPVQILIEGQRVDQLWGHVAVREPVRRADPYVTRSLMQVDQPAHGATVGRTFTVKGEAAAFEATVLWEVLSGGAVVRSGFTNSVEGQRFSAFEFTLTLDPGEYTLRVVEDDASAGAGRPPFEDTKVVRVTG